jgi:hypothetical protein
MKARAAGLGTARCRRSGIAGCLTRTKARAATAGALGWLNSFPDPKPTNTRSVRPGSSGAAHSLRCVDLICPVHVALVKRHENCWAQRCLGRYSTAVPCCAVRLLKVLRRATYPPMAAAAGCLVNSCPAQTNVPEVATFLDATFLDERGERPRALKRPIANCSPLPASFHRRSRSHFHDPQNLQHSAVLERDAKQRQSGA